MLARILLAVLCSLPAAPAWPADATIPGDDPLAGAVLLDRQALIQAVLARNPSLEAARQAWRAAAARPAQAGALADPLVSYGLAPLSAGAGDVAFGQEVRVEQPLPYPGRRSLRQAQAAAEAEAVLADYRTALLEIAAAAALLFEDYRLVDREQALNEEHLRLLRGIQETAAARYAAGLAMQQDPIQAEVEGAEVLARQAELAAERERLTAEINALLHRPFGLALPPPAPLPGPAAAAPDLPPAEELEEAALAARPEVARRQAELRARQSEAELARRGRRPDFELMGAYNSMWSDAEHRWMVGVAVNLPVWRRRTDAAAAEAEARLAQAASDREHLEIEVRAAVRAQLARLAAARRRAAVYADRLLPAVRDSLRAARVAFETGQAGFAALLEAERALRRAELGAEQARAALARAAGRLPDGSHPDLSHPPAPAVLEGGVP